MPYTWVKDSVWSLSDYELNSMLVVDLQVLCDFCLRRKKQIWKANRKEAGDWLKPYLDKSTIVDKYIGSSL